MLPSVTSSVHPARVTQRKLCKCWSVCHACSGYRAILRCTPVSPTKPFWLAPSVQESKTLWHYITAPQTSRLASSQSVTMGFQSPRPRALCTLLSRYNLERIPLNPRRSMLLASIVSSVMLAFTRSAARRGQVFHVVDVSMTVPVLRLSVCWFGPSYAGVTRLRGTCVTNSTRQSLIGKVQRKSKGLGNRRETAQLAVHSRS